MGDWPDPCPKCGAEAKLRKLCERCEEGIYVVEHLPPGASHYKWGNEVVPCKCSTFASKEADHIRHRKNTERKARDAGRRVRATGYITTPEMAKKAAEGLAKGLPASTALREAGWPKGSWRKGKAAINNMVRAELKTLGRKYIQIGRELTPEDQEAMIRGRLAENIIIGNDKGVMSAKTLGSDKRIAMWTPDTQVGMVVLQPPPMIQVDHEVPIIEPKYPLKLEEKPE